MKRGNIILGTVLIILILGCEPTEPDKIYGPDTYWCGGYPSIINDPTNKNGKLLGIHTRGSHEYFALRDDTIGNVISCIDKDGILLDSVFLYSQEFIEYDSIGNRVKTGRVFVIHTDTIFRDKQIYNDTIHISLSNSISFCGIKSRPYGDQKRKKDRIPTCIFKELEVATYRNGQGPYY